MQWHCHSGRLAGGGSCHHGMRVSWLPGRWDTDSLDLRLGEHGQGLPMVSEGDCSCCLLSCLLQPLAQTRTGQDHGALLSSATQPEICHLLEGHWHKVKPYRVFQSHWQGLSVVSKGGCSCCYPAFYTVAGPDKDTTRPWRSPVPSFRSHSARDFHKATDLRTTQHTQPCSAPRHGPTGSWRLPPDCNEGSSVPPTLSLANWPGNKIFSFVSHWLVLLVCVVFLGKTPGAFPYCFYFLSKFNL